jgi:Ca2+-binding EF-hand superfamily protein
MQLRLSQRELKALKEVCHIQKETKIPIDLYLTAVELFREHAGISEDQHFKEGFLTKEQLGKIMRSLGKLDAGREEDMLGEAFKTADSSGNGLLSFNEFAVWFSSHSFQEDFNIDAEEAQCRDISRRLGISLLELDSFKRNFRAFDADGSGKIDRDEFYDMLLKCLKVPKHIGMPSNRVQQLWQAADLDGSGLIDFEEFMVFYSKFFSVADGNSGIDQYYAMGSSLQTNKL